MRSKQLFARSASYGAALLAVLMLAACGGNAELGGSTGGGIGGDPDPGVAVASVVVLASATELDSSAATDGGVTLTALARDAANVVLSDVDVTWSATSGALASSGSQATLTTGGDGATRSITVQATAGGKTGSVAINVVPAPQPPAYRMGILNGASFQTGKIDIVSPSLGAGGSSGLRLNVVDVNNDNQLLNQPVSVSFNSPCISAGQAEVVAGTPGLGTINATYRAKGCSGSDAITATAQAPNGATLSASGTITIAADTTGAIEFVSASPKMIGIAGTGIPETSQLLFKVVNNSGGPVLNAAVSFELTVVTGALGVTMSATSGVTSSDGTVGVTVRAGSAPGTVRVRALADGKTAMSSALVVTTGLTVQDHYSVSAECFNYEALQIDGVQVPITVRMGDRYSNWPPEGTAAYFSASGGTIGAPNQDNACLTGSLDSADTAGTCTVTWRSQNPRPLDGRVTVTATSQGEDGAMPVGAPIALLETLTLVMSGSSPVIDPGDFAITGVESFDGETITIKKGAVATMRIIVRDVNDQPMPQGTTIALVVNDAGSVSGTSSWTVPCTIDDGALGNTYLFRIKAGAQAAAGSVELKVTVPSGLETVYSFDLAVID